MVKIKCNEKVLKTDFSVQHLQQLSILMLLNQDGISFINMTWYVTNKTYCGYQKLPWNDRTYMFHPENSSFVNLSHCPLKEMSCTDYALLECFLNVLNNFLLIQNKTEFSVLSDPLSEKFKLKLQRIFVPKEFYLFRSQMVERKVMLF